MNRLADGLSFLVPLTSLMIALVVTACGAADERRGSAWTETTDTVDGLRRVTNTPPVESPRPTIEAEEQLRVGTVEDPGPASFGRIRSVAVLQDGRFAVADAQAEEVRLFDRDGGHLRTFGGEGEGPGELRGMQGVHVDHEGMLRVAEQGNARLSVFDPDAGYVRSYRLPLYSFSFAGPWKATVDSTGRTFVDSSGRYGEGRYWSMVRVYDAEMNQLDSIPYYDYTDDADGDQPGAWRIDLGGGSYTWAQVPFFSRPYQVLAPTGEIWSSAAGASHLEVARWWPSGDTSLVMTSLRTPDPVTTAERDSAMSALREGLAARVASPPRLDASRVPATKPPLHGLSLDDQGRLWVRLTESDADSTVYDIFERGGGYAGTVRMPFRVDGWIPPVVRGDTVWVVVMSELRVQYVVRALLGPLADGDGD